MTGWRYSLGSLRHDPSVDAKEPLSGNLRDGRGDVDTVLPLELGPHAPELKSLTVSAMVNELLCSGCTDLLLRAIRRLDVVHDVDVHIVQDHNSPVIATLVDYVAKNGSSLCARNLDVCSAQQSRRG